MRAESEVDQPGYELAPTWDASVTSSTGSRSLFEDLFDINILCNVQGK